MRDVFFVPRSFSTGDLTATVQSKDLVLGACGARSHRAVYMTSESRMDLVRVVKTRNKQSILRDITGHYRCGDSVDIGLI